MMMAMMLMTNEKQHEDRSKRSSPGRLAHLGPGRESLSAQACLGHHPSDPAESALQDFATKVLSFVPQEDVTMVMGTPKIALCEFTGLQLQFLSMDSDDRDGFEAARRFFFLLLRPLMLC
mmetsp:Transcript_207/g.532  ORF Transcript_207/g.532 Transcript_207/m.532 type:complete len:120 (-) Transcript_207:410-769(-)|eukprot:CAMPEP_0171528188 /NCGR_PEP_ID=MMETSP0959-20130129/11502_1 /TAXON_ID=87120 /ORGANISM="Aurantiochytrium limacinum, Strain ATCCMYA-1381" /LENGTH=119 /DNA_ID=CAMNT_0012070079 /DNA_START=939 /DNA_END=1298 /DNA_ORIENTATION=+